MKIEKKETIQEANYESFADIVKAYEDENDFVVEGYAATDAVDVESDQLGEAALREAANILNTSRKTVLFNHDPNRPIGTILEASYKEEGSKKGIWIKALISKAVGDIRQMIVEGVLNKFSIKGITAGDIRQVYSNILDSAINVVQSLLPFEVSLCSVPINAEAELKFYTFSKAISKAFVNDKDAEGVEEDKGGEEMDGILVQKTVLEKAADGLTGVAGSLRNLFKTEPKEVKTEPVIAPVEKAVDTVEPVKVEEVVKEEVVAKAAVEDLLTKIDEVVTLLKGIGAETSEAFEKEKGVKLEGDISTMSEKIAAFEIWKGEMATQLEQIQTTLSGLGSVSKALVAEELKKPIEKKEEFAYEGAIFGGSG